MMLTVSSAVSKPTLTHLCIGNAMARTWLMIFAGLPLAIAGCSDVPDFEIESVGKNFGDSVHLLEAIKFISVDSNHKAVS